MVVTAALVSAVLIVDDATSAAPPSAEPSATPVANDVPTPFPTLAPGTDPPLPHRDARGVIQTTGGEAATVALTFDDGPSPNYTPQVLSILDKHDIKATFCVVGRNATAHPDLMREIADRGHTLCDHTVTHDLGLPTRDGERIHTEIGGALDAIHVAVPEIEVPFYRAPGGNFATNVIDVAAGYGLEPLGWSVDPRDWTEPGADAIQTTVVEGIGPGSIVLLHDGGGDQAGTVAALDGIIIALKGLGYQFVIPTM